MLTVIDEFTRRCMAVVVERRLNSDNVLHCLTELFVQHGPPDHIRSDNGSEFTAHAVRDWLGRIGVKTLYIEPGSPWENGYNESFNSKLRDEILNTEIFSTLKEAKVLIKRWRHHYNTIRPHSSLGYRPPAPETILPNVEGPTYAVDGLRLAHQLNPRQTLTKRWTTNRGQANSPDGNGRQMNCESFDATAWNNGKTSHARQAVAAIRVASKSPSNRTILRALSIDNTFTALLAFLNATNSGTLRGRTLRLENRPSPRLQDRVNSHLGTRDTVPGSYHLDTQSAHYAQIDELAMVSRLK